MKKQREGIGTIFVCWCAVSAGMIGLRASYKRVTHAMTFDDLDELLAGKGLLANPAELHGLLCGRVATGENLSNPDLDRLLIEMLDIDPEQLDELRDQFCGLYTQCLGQLQHQGFEFAPLLPGDEFPLSERTAALGEWCQGFLFGLGGAGAKLETIKIKDVEEVLFDLTAFAKLRAEDADDDDEDSYMELVEYVRVAVMLIHAHLGGPASDIKPVLH